MAIDLIAGNNTRYYSLPDSADWTFPDSDYFIYFWTRIDNNSGNFFQYIFSNNTFGSANSLNFGLSESGSANPNKWFLGLPNDGTLYTSTNSPGADGNNKLVVVTRSGTTVRMYLCDENSTASLEITATSSEAANGGVVNIGRRVDGQAARYYKEHFGDCVKGSVALATTQIELLAKGVSPVDVIGFDNLDIWLQFHEATSQVVDIIGGNVATRNGSGLLTSEHFQTVISNNIFISAAGVAPVGFEPQWAIHANKLINMVQ